MNLQIGLGGEALVAVGAGVVPPALVDHLHMTAQLDAAGEQFAALRTREHLLGDHLPPRVHPVLTSSEGKMKTLHYISYSIDTVLTNLNG